MAVRALWHKRGRRRLSRQVLHHPACSACLATNSLVLLAHRRVQSLSSKELRRNKFVSSELGTCLETPNNRVWRLPAASSQLTEASSWPRGRGQDGEVCAGAR